MGGHSTQNSLCSLKEECVCMCVCACYKAPSAASKHFVTSSFSSQMASLQFPEAPVIQPPRCPQAASWTLSKTSMWKMQNVPMMKLTISEEPQMWLLTFLTLASIPVFCNPVNHAKKNPQTLQTPFLHLGRHWEACELFTSFVLLLIYILSTVVTTSNRDLLESIPNGDWEKGHSQPAWPGIVYAGHTQHLYPTVDWKQSRRFCGFHSLLKKGMCSIF